MLVRHPSSRTPRRRGATIVESALVLGVFLMLLFGIFEYCRFLMVLHITNNAARDGARYAAVNQDKPATFNFTDYTDASGTVYPSVKKYTTARMGGVDKQINAYNDYDVAVYPVDPLGLTLTPPVIRSQPIDSTPAAPAGTYPDPFNTGAAYRPPWNQASFPERTAVTIKGTYRPVTPLSIFKGLAIMPDNIPIYITAVMGSEG